MKQERYTEQAQQAMATSQELVQQYHHNQWDVEHILLALLRQERAHLEPGTQLAVDVKKGLCLICN